jgi:copper chaperone NosL
MKHLGIVGIRRVLTISVLAFVSACGSSRPDAIAYDADQCTYCRMQISDPRFGAELLTRHGRSLKFDSIECVLSFYKQAHTAGDVASVWVSDFEHPGTLINAAGAAFVDIGAGRAPMGRGWVAVASVEGAKKLATAGTQSVKRWSDLQ